jgi:short-subunit dehydrogenase
MNTKPQVVIVTGASSGIGESIAQLLHQKGHKVYGTSRKPAYLHPSGFDILTMNVNETESVNQLIETVIAKENRIDVLVNNAGIGLAGAVEETSEADVKLVMDTNLIGLHRTCTAVLPHMRANKYGKIINIGSMAGMIGLPFRAYYAASKFATEGFSEALSMEVKQFGVKVVLVQPGDMKTSINQNRIEMESEKTSPYHKSYNFVRGKFKNAVENAFDPVVVAEIVLKIVHSKNPSFRYKKGAFFENFSHFVKKVVPFRWFETFVTMYYQMNKLIK